ncbi:MAG: gamma-glutamyltransferase family protein [Anaerolineae bacterium]|nr:gamma-glutamyltransferase family protein [Anaerolineae bacterium]
MDFQQYPFPSQRMPLMAYNGIVATSQPLAAQAGLHMLKNGGNAVDAVLAAAAALTVLEPTSNGIGSDAFALVWDGHKLHGLNGSGRSPKTLNADVVRSQGHTRFPSDGWLPVTVPGAPAAWDDLNQRFGRLDLKQVLAPAIAYAQEGYPVSPIIAEYWALAAERFLPLPQAAVQEWGKVFAPGGKTPQAGERWASPAHAQTLQRLADQGVRDFYEGEIAEKIVNFATATGGLLTDSDLAGHKSEWVEPIGVGYRGYEVWEIPPNGQGLTALIALSLLEGFDLAASPHGSEESFHLQIEAIKLAFADAERYIADPEHADIPVAGLLDPTYIAARRNLIGPEARMPEAGDPPQGGTVYLCAVDRDGMMVSYIQSNYQGFGSGVVVPDTGIALQNRGTCFSLEPGHPNEAAGGKRPYHTIIPSFLTRDHQPIGPFGVMGAFMQPQGQTQVVTGTVDYGLNPQAVLDAPRWRFTGGLSVDLEYGIPEHVVRGLTARGHHIHVPIRRGGFGRGQIIWRLDDGLYVAGSDMRTDGCAVGW